VVDEQARGTVLTPVPMPASTLDELVSVLLHAAILRAPADASVRMERWSGEKFEKVERMVLSCENNKIIDGFRTIVSNQRAFWGHSMIYQQDTIDLDQPAKRFGPLLFWCAAASLGVLFVKVTSLLGAGELAVQEVVLFGSVTSAIVRHLPLATPLLALVVWHLFPHRAWAPLLAVGALCALPMPLLLLSPEAGDDWMAEPLAILNRCAPVFTLVGILGAATMTWQAGRRALGATLAGAALMTQLVGLVVTISTSHMTGMYVPAQTLAVVSVVLILLALAGAVVAVVLTVRQPEEPAVRPRWRVTIAAGLLAGAPLLEYAFLPGPSRDIDENLYLYLGLGFAAAGLVAGALAGKHVLVGSAAAGLILGAFAVLVSPTLQELQDTPVLIVTAALGSLLAGLAAGMSRWRAQIGMTGIAVVAVGLGVLSFLFNSDQEYSAYEGFAQVATPVLLVIGVVAGVAALAAVGAAHSATAETPAVLSAMPTGFVLGTVAIAIHFWSHRPEDGMSSASMLPVAAVALLIAALLVGLVAASGRAGAPEELTGEPR
jgi:hypothetical protein